MATIDSVLPNAARLGECPVWSAAEQRLYWIDIEGREVHRFDPATGADEVRAVPGRPGSLALTAQAGRLLVAVEHRLLWLDWSSGSTDDWLDLEAAGAGIRLNDGRADPAGRFWVGSMFADTSQQRFAGRLHRLEATGAATVLRADVGVANGLAFGPDGRSMYFADTLRALVWAFDYEPATGVPRRERVLVDFAGLPGLPDGACTDEAGCYWVACVFGAALLRVSPAGRIDRRIDLPVGKPTMPAFGGSDLATLFVTSIGGDGPPRAGNPRDGRLLAIDGLGVRGIAEPVFAG